MTPWLLLAQDASHDHRLLLLGLILAGAALLLLLLELFVPTGGLIGVLAGAAAIASIVVLFMYDAAWGWTASLAYLVLGPILVVYGFRFWLHSPLAKGMILGGNDPAASDDDAAAGAEHARLERLTQLRHLIGVEGAAITPLRPIGVVRINGQRLDALAETGVIDAGTPVVVVDIVDSQVKVRPK